ncbi:MAG: hypothetical protein HXS44_16380 [Theionarchaea archaeon]|nr:hypothetical protein [Theionarchaea archaeon]
MKGRKLLVCILVFVIIAVTLPPVTSQPYWTVMVYMDGDNDLESAALDDFNELESAGSNTDVNIVVQIDRIPGYSTADGDWTTTRRYYVTTDPGGYNSTIVSSMISDLGELNMGNPTTLIDFVNWAQTNYPADYYLLVLWDHGDGWKTRSAQVFQKGPLTKVEKREPVKGICYDDTNTDYLTTPDIDTALTTITGGGATPIDVIGFDACLMGMLEIDYEVSPYGSYFVGSEESVPMDGWDYQATMNWLLANPTSTPDLVAARIVTDYMNFYGVLGIETHSAVDLSQVSAVTGAVNTLATNLMNNIDTYFYDILNARDLAEEYMDTDFIDLYDFAEQLQTITPDVSIQNDCQNVMNAVTSAVIQEGHGAGNAGSHGISIYFPYGAGDYLSRYETDTQFAQDTSWDEFLQTYYTTVPPPLHAVALIDDDNGRDYEDFEDYYTQALDALSIQYDYYDTSIFGSPTLAYLQAHVIVIWFTGSDFTNTLTPTDENNLISYLTGGGGLFLSSQDYVWDLKADGRYPSLFLRSYLHTVNEGEDTGVNNLGGVDGNEVGDGLGPYQMCWAGGSCTFMDYADWVTKDAASGYAFYNEDVEYVAITYSGVYDVIFCAFRFEGIGEFLHRQEVMASIFNFLGPIPAFGSLADIFSTYTFFVAGNSAYCTDVLGSAKIAFALGQGGASDNPEGRTDTILTTVEHDTGNLIPLGGPAINPIAVEFGNYFGITYNYQPGVSFEIYADSQSIFLDLTLYPLEDVAIIYLAEHNGRYVLLVWGFGWEGTYAASVFLGDIANWQAYLGTHMVMLRWVDVNTDGLVQANEISVEAST